MAESTRIREKLEEERTCPVCMDYFLDPVTLDCGHNFCSTCIEKILRFSERRPDCPVCKQVLRRERLKPNKQLGNMFEIVQDMSNLLMYRGVCSMEEAEKKVAEDQISRGLEILKKGREDILGYIADTEETSQEMLDVVNENKEESEDAFRTLHSTLREEEDKLLKEIEEMKLDIVRKRDEHLAVLSEDLSSLEDLIQETKNKLHGSENDLHKISGDILESCKQKKKKSTKKPFEFPADLNWRINDCKDVSVFLEGFMKQFQESMEPGLQLKEANVKLHPSFMHPLLILSEDRKSVRFEGHQDLPDDPAMYEKIPFVLAEEGFARGRYFWDVAVSNAQDWSVGTVIINKRNDGSDELMLVKMRMCDGKYSVFNGTGVAEPTSDVNSRQELKKIRVIVNIGGREVGFYDADTGDLLTIEFINVPNGRHVPLFTVSRKGHLTICPSKCQSQQRTLW